MNESISNLVNYLKEQMEGENNKKYNFLLNDNDNDITLLAFRSKLVKFDIESSIGMLDFIREVCKKVIKEFKPIEAYWMMALHSFEGYSDSFVDEGPIKVVFELGDEKSLTLGFSSKSQKNRNWIIDCVRYNLYKRPVEGMTENPDDFIELNNFLKALEKIEIQPEEKLSQESEGAHKK